MRKLVRFDMRAVTGFGGVLSVIFLASAVAAAIVSVSGAITLLASPPASVAQGDLESDTEIFLFAEQGLLTLPSAVSAVIASPNLSFTGTTIPSSGTVPSGTLVNSYFFHADKVGTSGIVIVSGSVTFDEDILAVIVTTVDLDASDGLLGTSATSYGSAAERGLENADDIISISGDLRTLGIQLFHGTVEDHVRVLTEASASTVPVLTLPALGVLAAIMLLTAGLQLRRRAA